MRIKRICKICGKSFLAIKTTQFFCNRRCFKKDYYQRIKNKQQEEIHSPSYPTKKCEFCNKKSQLNFDPLAFPRLFNAWGCPQCGATNRLIWQYQSSPQSHHIISNILISFQSSIDQAAPPQYQTYHLPISRPENGNPNVIIMTCEILNILDIQKKNRKRIIFS